MQRQNVAAAVKAAGPQSQASTCTTAETDQVKTRNNQPEVEDSQSIPQSGFKPDSARLQQAVQQRFNKDFKQNRTEGEWL